MPHYTLELVEGAEFRPQSTIVLEDPRLVVDRADQLATELSRVKPELKSRGCAVRVIDTHRTELYRTPVDRMPPWRWVQERF